jgi:hypothetical protein
MMQVLTVNQVFEIMLNCGNKGLESHILSFDPTGEAGKVRLDDDDDAAKDATNGDHFEEDMDKGLI